MAKQLEKDGMTETGQLEEYSAKRVETVPCCVILARKEVESPWADYTWEPVSVVLDAPQGVHGKIASQGEGWTHYFMECNPLELHRKDAPAYRECIQDGDKASLWVVLAEDDDVEEELPYYVQLVTASPYEAQDYLDSGELIIEAVDMPELLRAFIKDYVERCPPEEEFIKRKQKKKFHEEHSFGQQSLHEIRQFTKKRH